MVTRVLIVDASPLARGVLSSALRGFSDLEVVGAIADGVGTEMLVRDLRPDVVTLNVAPPRKHGLDTMSAIMASCPTPIVAVTEPDAELSTSIREMEAMAHGAIASFRKPRLGIDAASARHLADLVRMSGRVPMRRLAVRRVRRAPRSVTRCATPRIIGIVSSTGGPRVLQNILDALPKALPCPIAIVQHTNIGSAESLALWLRNVSGRDVSVARDGQKLAAGQVVLADDDAHLTVNAELYASVGRGPRVYGRRPSGTTLLRSLAQGCGAHSLGVVLSGMGSDGAAGAALIEWAGGLVLIEDPSTAVVGSMPAEALARTRRATVEPADEIGPVLRRLLSAAES